MLTSTASSAKSAGDSAHRHGCRKPRRGRALFRRNDVVFALREPVRKCHRLSQLYPSPVDSGACRSLVLAATQSGPRHYLSRRALGVLVGTGRRGGSSSGRRRLSGDRFPGPLRTYLNGIAPRPDLVSAGLQQTPTEHLPAPRPSYRDRCLLRLDGTCGGHGRDSHPRHT